MRARTVKRFVAPVAFLAAVTVAVLVVRAGLQQHTGRATTTTTVPPPVRRHVVTTTTRTRPKTARPKRGPRRPAGGARFYTVVAGDTFGVISSKAGIRAARLQQLNPKVQSTALFIGQRLRIR